VLLGAMVAGRPGAAVLGPILAWLGRSVARSGARSGSVAATRHVFMRRYWVALAAASLTCGALLRARAEGGRLDWPFLVVVVGGPLAAMLLARAAAGVRGGVLRSLAAFVLGGTVVLVIAVLLYPPVTAVVLRIGTPPMGAVLRTLDTLSAGLLSLAPITAPTSVTLITFTVMVSPLVEEIAKPIGGVVVNPRSRAEAFAFAAAAGAGFAVAENVIAAFGGGVLSWFPVSAVRAASSAVPVLGAGIMGLALHDRQLPGAGLSLPRALALAGMLHGLWNAIITATSLLGARTVFSLSGTAVGSWGRAAVPALAVIATLAVAGLVRVGTRSRAQDPAPVLGLRTRPRPRRTVAVAWTVFGIALAVPIAWGLLDASPFGAV